MLKILGDKAKSQKSYRVQTTEKNNIMKNKQKNKGSPIQQIWGENT